MVVKITTNYIVDNELCTVWTAWFEPQSPHFGLIWISHQWPILSLVDPG